MGGLLQEMREIEEQEYKHAPQRGGGSLDIHVSKLPKELLYMGKYSPPFS